MTTADLYASVDTFKAAAYRRVGEERLPAHLATTYGISVSAMTELDAGVFRVEHDRGTPWVTRLFPAVRPLTAVEGDAEILRFVEEHGFPAERCVPDAVSAFDGQGVLVTEYVAGENSRGNHAPATLHRMGELLGRLHTMPLAQGATTRDAGSWHSLTVEGGSRSKDIEHLSTLLADAARRVPDAQRPQFDLLRSELAQLDVGEGLPHALTHPDFGPANAMKTSGGEFVFVDWTGAGAAPRVCALGLLLSYAGSNLELVDAISNGHRLHVQLEDEELARLPDSIRAFALILACWGVVCWGAPADPVLQGIAAATQQATAVTARVRDVYAGR